MILKDSQTVTILYADISGFSKLNLEQKLVLRENIISNTLKIS